MQTKQLWFIPLGAYKEKIQNYTYLRILSSSRYGFVKLSVNLENYKYKHLLEFNNLIYADLIKTRKNWILKDILESKQWIKPLKYEDFLKLGELNKLVLDYFYDNHEVEIYDYLLSLGEIKNFSTTNIEIYKNAIQEKIGIFDKM